MIDPFDDALLIATDNILFDWWLWTTIYELPLGYDGVASYCDNAPSPRQWDSTADIHDEIVQETKLMQVEKCVHELPAGYARSIEFEMQMRYADCRVWRTGVPYEVAREAIIPLLLKFVANFP